MLWHAWCLFLQQGNSAEGEGTLTVNAITQKAKRLHICIAADCSSQIMVEDAKHQCVMCVRGMWNVKCTKNPKRAFFNASQPLIAVACSRDGT